MRYAVAEIDRKREKDIVSEIVCDAKGYSTMQAVSSLSVSNLKVGGYYIVN